MVSTCLRGGSRHGVRARCVSNRFYNRQEAVVYFLLQKFSLWSHGNKAVVFTSTIPKIAAIS